MRSHRQILADIHEFGLDPTIAHRETNASGRLKRPVVHSDVLKNALVILPEVEEPVCILTEEPQSEVEENLDIKKPRPKHRKSQK
jgi:hypothetical protein